MRGVNYQQATAPPGQFRAVTAGDFHTGVLQADGTAQCWDGTTSDKRTAFLTATGSAPMADTR